MRELVIAIFIFCLIPSAQGATCEDKMVVSISGQETSFCKVDGRMLSLNCAARLNKCSLVIKIDEKVPQILKKESIMKYAATQNPGSKMCHLLGWNEVLADMFDGSKLCICSNSKNESVFCTSLLH